MFDYLKNKIDKTNTANDQAFLQILSFLSKVIEERLQQTFAPEKARKNLKFDISSSQFDQTPLTHFLEKNDLNSEETLALLIALAPHLQADFFDQIIREQIPKAGDFPQFGGVRGKNFRGFLPTGETVLFILAGFNLKKRFEIQQLFSPDHLFSRNQILWLEEPPEGEPRMSGRIILSQEMVDLLTTGKVARPRFGLNFPAQLIETKLEWNDLVLNSATLQQIKDLETWVAHGETLLQEWGMGRKLKPGYRALFHGPPGTGKTLTASLLGKYTGKDVYKIDLSMIVSKFIGETEKNLSNLFAKAENKDWVLFFDEADALFGKRTNVRDAHDKYANQEVSYLLQRVETYNGLVILASNFKSNIDDAFVRRFQSIIHFPIPKPNDRLRIWKQSFPSIIELSPEINLKEIAQKYELTGADIMNVVQYCCLEALGNNSKIISMQSIVKGIRKEFDKQGKIV